MDTGGSAASDKEARPKSRLRRLALPALLALAVLFSFVQLGGILTRDRLEGRTISSPAELVLKAVEKAAPVHHEAHEGEGRGFGVTEIPVGDVPAGAAGHGATHAGAAPPEGHVPQSVDPHAKPEAHHVAEEPAAKADPHAKAPVPAKTDPHAKVASSAKTTEKPLPIHKAEEKAAPVKAAPAKASAKVGVKEAPPKAKPEAVPEKAHAVAAKSEAKTAPKEAPAKETPAKVEAVKQPAAKAATPKVEAKEASPRTIQAPAPAKPAAPPPEAAPKAAAKPGALRFAPDPAGGYAVAVGAFNSQRLASLAEKRLEDLGFPHVRAVIMKDAEGYTLTVGAASEAVVQNVSKALADAGYKTDKADSKLTARFVSQDEAEKAKAAAEKAGGEASIKKAVGQIPLWRVLAGPTTAENARKAQDVLKTEGMDCVVVRYKP